MGRPLSGVQLGTSMSAPAATLEADAALARRLQEEEDDAVEEAFAREVEEAEAVPLVTGAAGSPRQGIAPFDGVPCVRRAVGACHVSAHTHARGARRGLRCCR